MSFVLTYQRNRVGVLPKT